MTQRSKSELTALIQAGQPLTAASLHDLIDSYQDLNNTVTMDDIRPQLSRFRTALASAASSPVNIMALGTSITEGANSSTLEGRWVASLRNKMRTRLGLTGGQGYIKSWFGTTGTSLTEPWTRSGSVTDNLSFGIGGRNRQLASSASMQISFTGTGVRVYYGQAPGNGHLGIQIDSGSVTDLDTSGGSILPTRYWDSAALAAGSHTITLSSISGNVFVEGIFVFNGDESNGIHIFEAGLWGQQLSVYTSGGASTYLPYWFSQVQPHLVLIEGPINEWWYNTSPSTWTATISSLLATIRSNTTVMPSICWILNYERGGMSSPTYTWQQYRDALFPFAAANNICVFDTDSAFGKQAWSSGLIDTDQTHLTGTGIDLFSTLLTSYLR